MNNIPAIPGSEHHNLQYDLPFLFLDLPAELRNRIYGCIFNREPVALGLGRLHVRGLYLKSVQKYFNPRLNERRDRLAPLEACRQIYNEARDIPLACNLVSFYSIEHIVHFLHLVVDLLYPFCIHCSKNTVNCQYFRLQLGQTLCALSQQANI